MLTTPRLLLMAPWLPLAKSATFLLLVLFTLAGCRQLSKLSGPDKRYDLLESELRTRERELLEARSELAHLRQLADPYNRPAITGPLLPEPYPPVYRAGPGGPLIKEVLLGNGSGGRDDDGIPGDELLQVVIVPKDDDGTAVKVPLRALVAAFEITREGLKLPIGKWEVMPEQLRKTWRSGLFGSGYFVPLSWDRPPSTDRIRLAIRVQTADGREFEADRDVRVTPLGGRAIPAGSKPPASGPAPPGSTELPPPTLLQPSPSAPTVIPPP